jgi:hypothetical protein
VIEAWLVRETGIEKDKAPVLARMAAGSPGKALDMGKGDFLEKRQELLGTSTGSSICRPRRSWNGLSGITERRRRKEKVRPLPFSSDVWKTWYRDLAPGEGGLSGGSACK